LHEEVKSGRSSLRRVLEVAGAVTLEPNDAGRLVNINTPADLEALTLHGPTDSARSA
jgi:molybdopterin-guanine dinucleotide biosynthesis protein A